MADDEAPFAIPTSWIWARIGSVSLLTDYGTLDSYDQASVWHNGPPDYAELTFPTDRLVQPALVVSQG